MTTHPVHIRVAQQDDVAGLVELWQHAFTPPLQPDQWLADPDRLVHTLVAVDDEGICGSIYGLPKRLREDDGESALVHCIGSVAVAERTRGRGVARRLVSASLDSAEGEWALLFTGTPEVYRSSGFTSFTMQRVRRGPWQAPATDGREADVGSADERSAPEVRVSRRRVAAGCLAPLQDVYERSRDGVVLAPVRSARDWTMAEVRLHDAELWIAQAQEPAGGRGVLGYAVTRTRAEDGALRGVIEEFAVDPDAPQRLADALLRAIGDDWAAVGVTSCELAVPATTQMQEQVEEFAPEARPAPDDTGMIRPLRREARVAGIRHFTAADYF